ncbi:hypothetical protein HK099_006071 [Clydaea vesicula]|uniref:Methyltransferase FkbM domain-containing protein n=1 Tax=Clydaea vesicula TaxID=447962 RepID=A0AAD5Y0Z4_9FUNG|nr:hypothetical protein HK099_006071 [Clydaea vesicula]KAJ3397111.1 hypothetical protein HDU92_000811 [Lobulomyces angularis]
MVSLIAVLLYIQSSHADIPKNFKAKSSFNKLANINYSPTRYATETKNNKFGSEENYQPYYYELPECSLGFKTRSVVVTAFTRPYRNYLHNYGEDVHVSESIFGNAATGLLFEHHVREKMFKMLGHFNLKHPVIVDIGANIGLHALYFASLGYEVHAFEPFKKNADLISCSIAANQFHNVKFNRVGLSEEDSTMCMDVPDNTNHGHAVVNTNANCNNPLEFIRFDHYLTNIMKGRVPDLIKIDIEGHEYKALITAKEIFKKKKPKLIFSEFNPLFMKEQNIDPKDYLKFLIEIGYNVYTMGLIQINLDTDLLNPALALWDIIAIDKDFDSYEIRY